MYQRYFQSQDNEIPTFKATIGSLNWQIPIILNIIGKERIRLINEVNKEIANEFVNTLKSIGRRAILLDDKKFFYEGETYEGKKAHRKYLISQIFSLAIPSAISLGLISQQEKEEMLTYRGKVLLNHINMYKVKYMDDNKEVFNVFSKIIFHQDNKNWLIIKTLKENDNGLTVEDIINHLFHKGIKIKVSSSAIERNIKKNYLNELEKKGYINTWRDREFYMNQLDNKIESIARNKIINAKINKLKSILNLLKNVDLILINNNKYYINYNKISNIIDIKINVDINNLMLNDFFAILKKNYEYMKNNQKYVIIPLLRDAVCWDLKIFWNDFDRLLNQLGLEYNNHKIALIPPITSKVWGIFKNTRNLYFISIEEMT